MIGLGGALLAWFALRRRYRPAAWLAVVAPLAVMGAIALLFDIDLLLPPLR